MKKTRAFPSEKHWRKKKMWEIAKTSRKGSASWIHVWSGEWSSKRYWSAVKSASWR